MNLRNVEHDLSLTALVVGAVKISLTSLSTSDTNSFSDGFNDEIIIVASFTPTCFSSTICIKFFSWVSNFYLCRSLLKNKEICWNSWPNSSSRNTFKNKFQLPEVFQWGLSAKICYEYSWQPYQLLDKKKLAVVFHNFRYNFYRSFFFLKMIRNFPFSR